MSSWASSHTIMRAMSNGFAGWLRAICGGVVGSGGADVPASYGGQTVVADPVAVAQMTAAKDQS